MSKQGLIIGIDYTSEYCQACYYSRRHECPESIYSGTEEMRYRIPTALSFDSSNSKWLIGQAAIDYATEKEEYLFQDLLANVAEREKCIIDNREYTYTQLLAIYFGKIIELVQLSTSIMAVENITVNLREINHDVKNTILEAFAMLKLPASKIKLQSCAESFAYYVLNENKELWEKGTQLFDFSSEGFFEKQLSLQRGSENEEYVYVYEDEHSEEFFLSDNEGIREQMDEKLDALFLEVIDENPVSSVFFVGKGFEDIWFDKTLKDISENTRAFKGNNLYAKGACLAGLRRSKKELKDLAIVCDGRTKVTIAVEARYKGTMSIINLSRASVDWFDAGIVSDFIIDNIKVIRFYITSMVSKERTFVDFDISDFPQRPNKATRIEIEIRYLNDCECEISIKDKGFGEFFPASDAKVTKRLNMEGYV
ncbi:MAG: DUF5716 family protein [Lachnospiraceae bacterium]|nr:DUF5716 family protein [Lachnospiraceae bacterium]